MSQEQERIARLEANYENLKGEIIDLKDVLKAFNNRMSDVERVVWKAIGALAVADLAMRFFLK